MEFWNNLSTSLKQKRFSTVQINKFEEAFRHLDAAKLLGQSPDQLLPKMTGRTVAEKRQKIETLLAVVRELQVASVDKPLPGRPQRSNGLVSFTVRLIKTDATKKPPFEHLGASAELLNKIDEPSDLLFRGRRDSRGRPPLLAENPKARPDKPGPTGIWS